MSKVFYDLGQTICPSCHYVADSLINFYTNEPSKAGDIAFCDQCHELSIYISKFDRRKLTPEELLRIFAVRPDIKENYERLKKMHKL